MKKDCILITSNFSSDTGFAWKFFFMLFNAIAGSLYDRGIGICLSFARVVEPVTILDNRLPFHVFTFDPLNLSFKGILNLRKNIKEHNIRYGYFTDYHSWHWLYALMRLWGIRKIVVHSHISVPSPYPPPSEKGIKRVVKKAIQNTRLFTADSIYVCSEFLKDRLVRVACCPEEKITVINHGIDIDRFLCEPSNNSADRKIRIVSIARATRYKGVHVLIEATRLLRDKYNMNNFVVEYGGDGPDLQAFKDLVQEYKIEEHFIFLGELEDTKNKICPADIVVVPSCWGDAYPLSVIEAMSAGKPIVATDVGGIPEEFGDDDCGFLIKPNDSEALAKCLFDLVRDSEMRSRLGANARKHAERCFTQERFYNEVLTNLHKDLQINK